MGISLCASETNEQGMELTFHGTAAFPVACYLDNLREMSVPWHWHEELELVIVAEGTMAASTDGSVFSIKKGDGLFLNKGILHQMKNGADTSCLLRSLVFHGRLAGSIDSIFWQKYMEPLLLDTNFPFCLLSRRTDWQREALLAAEAAWNACLEEKPGYEFSVRNSLSDMLYLLYSNRPHTDPKKPSPKTLRDDGRIKKMLSYIHAHISEELTVPRIAASASVSESECLRCFKHTIGVAPGRYVAQYRLQKAAELLAASCDPIAAVAALCGFQDMSYFARSFRKAYAMTPSAYRDAHMLSSSPPMPSSSNISR